MSIKQRVNNNKGMALAVVIIIFAVTTILCLTVLSSVTAESTQTYRNERYNEAYYLAEAAARLAVKSISGRINLYNLAYLQYDSEQDESLKSAYLDDLLAAHAALNLDIVPGIGGKKYMTVQIDGASYPITITRKQVNPLKPSPFHLVVTSQAESRPMSKGGTFTVKASIKMGQTRIVGKTYPSNLGDGIQTTGNLSIEQNGVLNANIHAGGSIDIWKTKVIGLVTAVGDIRQMQTQGQIIGDAIAGGMVVPFHSGGAHEFISGKISEGVPETGFYVNADIITPEMVWLSKEIGTLPILKKGPASALPHMITNEHSGYYTDGTVLPGNYTVDLKDGSVALIFDRYFVPNSIQPVFTVKNSDPSYTADNEHNFYFIIKEPYSYPDDIPAIKNPADLFRVESNNKDLFLNHPSIGGDVRTYIIVLNAGSQKYIYENFIDPASMTPEDLAEMFIIPGGAEIIRTPGSYSEYYSPISFNNGAELHAHIIAPLCELSFKNNNYIAGTIRAAKVMADNQLDFNIRPIDADLGVGETPFKIYEHIPGNTWIKP